MDESSRFDIYGLEWNKTEEKLLFMPENIFLGTNLYSPLHFHGFEVKQKILMFNFSRRLISNTTAAATPPPPPGEPILLKFYQNVSNRNKQEVTELGGARQSRFRVMVNNLMVQAKMGVAGEISKCRRL